MSNVRFELILMLLHAALGYLFGYIYLLESFKKKSIFKDSLFSLFYIILYLKLLDSFIIQTNYYLLIISLISFLLTLRLKNRLSKHFTRIYALFNFLLKLLKTIAIPRILIIAKNKHKINRQIRKKYKQYPWPKNSSWELF